LALGDVSTEAAIQRLDRLLLKFVKTCFAGAHAFHVAIHAALAAQHKLHIRRWQLKKTWAFMWRWRYSRASQRRPPLPHRLWEAVLGTCIGLAAAAKGDERLQLYGAALCLWAGFLALLRPCELLALARSTLVLACDLMEVNRWAVVVIDNPKTRKSFGYRQFALIECPRFAAWARWLLSQQQEDRLYRGSASQLTQVLRRCLSLLGVSPELYSLSSLRAGGATYAYRQSPSALPALQFQGRWKVTSTMHHYLQAGMVELLGAMVPESARPGVNAMADFFTTLSDP
jgi:hypothetical protein